MVSEEEFTATGEEWGKQYREKKEDKREATFRVVDFMGQPRCYCCDEGWDGLSRSVHNTCIQCGKEHMETKFPYRRDLNALIPVLKKLNFISIAHQVFRKDMFTTTIHFHVRSGTEIVLASADTINESALKAIVLAIDAKEKI